MAHLHLPIANLEPPVEPAIDASADASAEPLLQVGELARAVGKTVRALHLYEELGLLKPHARSKGKFRLYGPDALTRVRWISKLQDVGLSLAEITELARSWGESDNAQLAMTNVRRVLEERLADTRLHLQRLQLLQNELIASIEYLDICDMCSPVRVQTHCHSCDLHDCHEAAPELVRGVQVAG